MNLKLTTDKRSNTNLKLTNDERFNAKPGLNVFKTHVLNLEITKIKR